MTEGTVRNSEAEWLAASDMLDLDWTLHEGIDAVKAEMGMDL